MPKLIDHTERKEFLSAAVWKLLDEHGVSAISIRNVAAEAGITAGSLRHSFKSRLDLLEYALQLLTDRIQENVRAWARDGLTVDGAVRILEFQIPLIPATETYARVMMGMIAEMRSTPELRKIAHRSLQQLRITYHDMFAWLERAGELTPVTDAAAQADQLLILGQGITAKTILDGRRSEPVDLSRAFRTHLNKVLVHPVPYLTEEEIAELTKELARYRSTSSSSAH